MFNARSYSDLQTYGRCPKQYQYRVINNLQRKKRGVALYQGSLAHEAWMVYYLAIQASAENPWGEVEDFFLNKYEEDSNLLFEDELADKRIIIEDTEDILARYLYFHEDDWTILHVEEQFFVTLDSGEMISFTPDLIIRDADGLVWIVDHKTTSAMPKDGVPFSDLQALLYYAGVKELYPDLQGFIFNYARKKRPSEVRLNKTMGKDGIRHVNNVMKLDTTYEMLFAFLTNEAPQLLDLEMYRRRLAELRDNNRFFFREYLTFSDEQANAVLQDAADRVQLIELSEQAGLYPRTFQKTGVQGCEGCGFRSLCHGEMLDWNTQLILDEEYEPRDPKNPYETETE